MPLFDFRCHACGHEFTELVSLKDKEHVKCPKCGEGPVHQLYRPFSIRGCSNLGNAGGG